jgi:hypothetical protein
VVELFWQVEIGLCGDGASDPKLKAFVQPELRAGPVLNGKSFIVAKETVALSN